MLFDFLFKKQTNAFTAKAISMIDAAMMLPTPTEQAEALVAAKELIKKDSDVLDGKIRHKTANIAVYPGLVGFLSLCSIPLFPSLSTLLLVVGGTALSFTGVSFCIEAITREIVGESLTSAEKVSDTLTAKCDQELEIIFKQTPDIAMPSLDGQQALLDYKKKLADDFKAAAQKPETVDAAFNTLKQKVTPPAPRPLPQRIMPSNE